jgi:hypothetical protein
MARPRKTDARSKQLKARFTEAELQTVNAVAEQHGMTISDLLRFGVLRQPPPPSRRNLHPVKDRQELARLLGAVGRIGNNVNQIAHVANAGSWPESIAIHEAVSDIQWMRQALMKSLGVHEAQPEPGAP